MLEAPTSQVEKEVLEKSRLSQEDGVLARQEVQVENSLPKKEKVPKEGSMLEEGLLLVGRSMLDQTKM